MNLTHKIINRNILGTKLTKCSTSPITGYRRNGYCEQDINDTGKHFVCAEMNNNFLNFTEKQNNPLRSVVKEGENWCLCENRYKEAYEAGFAPKVIENATNSSVSQNIKNTILSQTGGKTKKKNKQFLYNPNDPKKSFDVYIDKNPNDTIPIKYTTVNDIKNTILNLEKLYKNNKYSHKRIWQVAMIMKVRLEVIRKYRKTKYKNAKFIERRYILSKRYLEFLSKRTKKKENERKLMNFKI